MKVWCCNHDLTKHNEEGCHQVITNWGPSAEPRSALPCFCRQVIPKVMYDEDGVAIGVRGDQANTARGAFRFLFEEVGEWYFGDLEFTPEGLRAAYRKTIERITSAFMRVAEESEQSAEFGEHTWVWCSADDPRAVPYWDVG